MQLITKKPRPLDRASSGFRDDRLFIIACDDTYAPKQYFDFFNIPRVKVHVVPTEDGSSHATYVLGRIMEYECAEYDEKWMLLDTDHCTDGSHQRAFIQALQDAKQSNVNVALSRPCFEYWLLLHHIDSKELVDLSTAADVEAKMRDVLGSYNKTNLQSSDFTSDRVVTAYQRAREVDQNVSGGDIPEANTTRVYQLWHSIITSASTSQLSGPLLELHHTLEKA